MKNVTVNVSMSIDIDPKELMVVIDEDKVVSYLDIQDMKAKGEATEYYIKSVKEIIEKGEVEFEDIEILELENWDI